MAESKPQSFDAFIKADRAKKSREELASKLLGRGRKENLAAQGRNRVASASPVPSLASRMGVNKRQPPTGPRASLGNRANGNTSLSRPQLSRAKSTSSVDHRSRPFPSRQQRTAAAIAQADKMTVDHQNGGINIRGMAGPYTVIASNFAPGTTAADIEAVMAPIGGEMTYCKLISSRPTVIVEMEFVEKAGADDVISMFNNKKADGRQLYVYMKEGPSHQFSRSSRQVSAPQTRRQAAADADGDAIAGTRGRRAPIDYQDGRYGFFEDADARPLQSDSMLRRGPR